MYNVLTTDSQGNVTTKVEPENKIIFYLGNSMLSPDISKIMAVDINNQNLAFAWTKEEEHTIVGPLGKKVTDYLDNL